MQSTPLKGMLGSLRKQASERMWGAAVQYARKGGVRGISDDGDEAQLHVKTPARALPYQVWLWPRDPDWDCDCGKGGVCVHIVAAAICLGQSREAGDALPEPKKEFKVALRYDFTAKDRELTVTRMVVYGDGREELLKGSLAKSNLLASRGDVQAEGLLAMLPGRPLPAENLRRLLGFLEGIATATLHGEPVTLSTKPVLFRLRVIDDGEGFKIGLYSPKGIETLYRGAAKMGDALHPTSHGALTPEQRKMLIRGVHYTADEVAGLVSETLPRLSKRIPIDIETTRLPQADALVPRVAVTIKERPEGLEIKAQLVYGDPPVASIGTGGVLKRLSDSVVPARDMAAERVAQRQFEQRLGKPVGFTHVLKPEEAVHFLQNQLPMHDGPVNGKVDPKRFRVVRADVSPLIEVLQSENDDQRWRLDVSFGEGDYEADPFAVLDAWQAGRSLVPLLDGGWAPLPKDWLTKHGTLLRELLDARDAKGQVDRNATAALVELLEDTDAVVPKDLARLQRFLAGAEGLPEAVLPEGFNATLRPYQQAGFRWLCFLRDMSLNGILADDMGLGKTVQALTVLADTKGPHLVVAPTSVLRNWASETARFAPRLKVNVYHGASRHLDEDADIIITSYALLRLDLDALQQREWGWVVLDEAQAIKNPSSQTARSACKVPSRHRLCLTGTPVENRLEELWSLFRFLMPGLLGSERGFRDRFVRPIENGDDATRTALRHRVKPYALRRLKRQVAPELPKLTEVIVRCTMGEAQRKVYEAVRIAARAEVREALAIPGKKGATFQVLEALLRMRQACCDPRLLPGDAGAGAPSAKLDRMEELLVEVVAEDHKALVFSQWTSLLDQAQARLDDLGIAWVRLDGATRNRQDVIDHFQSGDGPPVFLLSLKAGGTGLNLTAADYVIHLDPWWNPAVERQATDRAHRIGQDKPVVSVKLIAQDSVEERILLLQDAKRDLAEAALGTEGGFVKALSSAELRELFEDL